MTVSRRSFLSSLAAAPLAAPFVTGGALLPAAAQAAGAAKVPPATYSFQIGAARVSALLDGHIDLSMQLVQPQKPELAAQAIADAGQHLTNGALKVPVNAYVIQNAGRTVLVDAGTPDLMGPGLGQAMSALEVLGIAPEDVDQVLLTHAHIDHIGGLLNASGAPRFVNAELALNEAEHGFLMDDAVLAATPESFRPAVQAARTSVSAYGDRVTLFNGEVDLAPGLRSLPLPGHTPGHVGFQLTDGDAGLMIWGDLIHMTALQFAYPDWTVAFDADAALTGQTRRAFLDRAAAEGMLVAGMHMDFPGLGRVKRTGAGFAYQPAAWQSLL